MKAALKPLLFVLLSFIFFGCEHKETSLFEPKIIYQSDHLIITQISEHSFEHTSYLQTNDFGNVPCNGLIVTNNKEAVIFDTPTNDEGAAELIKWIKETLNYKINAVVATHFHNDCLGGLKAFHDQNISSYAYSKTIELAKENNFTVPQNSFDNSVTINVGNEKAIVKFFGEGHTKDNTVGYFPKENILFGGCLIKEIDATKGYLGDSNVEAWSATVQKIKEEYPEVKIVIPGHGKTGDDKLLDYTINLFKGS